MFTQFKIYMTPDLSSLGNMSPARKLIPIKSTLFARGGGEGGGGLKKRLCRMIVIYKHLEIMLLIDHIVILVKSISSINTKSVDISYFTSMYPSCVYFIH